jgi:hypothetical protein
MGFARSDMSSDSTMRNAELNLYSKAPLMLFNLEEKIGKDRFLTLCNELIKQNVNTTNEFLSILKIMEGEETANQFEDLLKTY